MVAVWGASGVLEDTPIIRMAYDCLKRNKRFECYAWIRIVQPFNRTEFLRNIISQFYIEDTATLQQVSTHGAQDLRRMGIMEGDILVYEFKKYVNLKSYMIVLTIEEWDQIKACFPNNNTGSRLLVCAQRVEAASLCYALDKRRLSYQSTSNCLLTILFMLFMRR